MFWYELTDPHISPGVGTCQQISVYKYHLSDLRPDSYHLDSSEIFAEWCFELPEPVLLDHYPSVLQIEGWQS